MNSNIKRNSLPACPLGCIEMKCWQSTGESYLLSGGYRCKQCCCLVKQCTLYCYRFTSWFMLLSWQRCLKKDDKAKTGSIEFYSSVKQSTASSVSTNNTTTTTTIPATSIRSYSHAILVYRTDTKHATYQSSTLTSTGKGIFVIQVYVALALLLKLGLCAAVSDVLV